MCFESLVVINIHIRSQFSKESKQLGNQSVTVRVNDWKLRFVES